MPTDWGGGAGQGIAQTVEELGRIRAQQAQQQGQIWGGALSNLGNLIAQAPQRQALEQERQARAQELQGLAQDRQLRAQAMQQEQDRQARLGQFMQQAASDPSMRDESGTLDFSKLAAAVAPHDPKTAAEFIQMHDRVLTARKTLGDINAQRAKLDDEEANKVASVAATTSEPYSLLAGLHSAGVSDAKITQISNDFEAGKPYEAVKAGLLSSSSEWRKQQSTIAEKTVQTPAEIETARHNAATEAIQHMNVGREAAAQAETARHNRAQEGIEGLRVKNEQAGVPPATLAATPDVAPGQRNDAFLKTLEPPMAAQVKALAEGRQAFPTGAALRSGYWQNMLQAVAKYDPSFDAVNYSARAKTRADFTSGKSAQTVNALNTVVGHLAELSDKADALGNGSMPFVNSVKNWISRQGGSQKVTNFETAKQAVADELTRVYRQAGGSEQDIKAWNETLNAAGSPEQLHGAFATIGGLLESKLQASQNQYEQGMGTSDVQMVTPKARAALNKLEGRAPQAASGGGTAPTTIGRFKVEVH